MKILKWFPILLLFPLLVSSAAAVELTFSEAAKRMIERNPILAQRQLQSEAAEKERKKARSAYFPQIDFVQSWNRSDNPVFVFGTLLNQRAFTEANFRIDSLNEPDPVSDVSSQFRLSWLLYDFGLRESRMDATASGVQLADYTQEITRNNLLQELVRRYYAVSLSQERVRTSMQSLRSAQAREEQAQLRVQEGLRVATESLSAAVFLARKKQELIDSQNALTLANKALEELLGETSPDGTVTTTTLQEKEFELPELTWWTAQMRSNRAELKIAAESRRLASAQAKASRAAFLPALQGWSGYEWHGEDLDYSGSNWGAGVELRWNLFRGLSDSAQYGIAKVKEKEAEEKERETENALRLQIESAYYSFQSAAEKVKVAAAILDEAEENQRIHAERYTAGLVSIQDTLQADAQRAESLLFYFQNLYELYVKRAELWGAAGLPDRILAEE